MISRWRPQVAKRLWRWGLYLCSLGCLLASYLHAAARPEFRNLFATVAQQALDKAQNQASEAKEMRQLAAAAISSTLFRSFYQDSSLYNTRPEVHLIGLREARGKELARFQLLDLAQAFAEEGDSLESFERGLRELGVKRNILLDWDGERVRQAMARVYKQLQLLDSQDVSVVSSAHYLKDDWSGEIRFSWYPTSGQVRLYAVMTFTKRVNIRTIILNANGRVFLGAKKPHERQVAIEKCSLDVSTQVTSASGRWSDPQAQRADGPGRLFIDNSARLQVKGRRVEGRVIESIMAVDQEGGPWTIEYFLSGQSDSFGNMRGQCAIKGDPQALLLRFGASEAPAGATWQASWREAQIKGLIKIAGSKGINWQVTVND